MSKCQIPQFSTQIGLENIRLEDGEKSSVKKKKPRELYTRNEDTLLIQSWVNVSKDPLVGVDQKAVSLWLRIAVNYNENRGQSREKENSQLKSQWHRINSRVQKFVGCYKQAVHGKKSGTSEKDILVNAHAFYAQDMSEPFNLEYAWRLLKDEPKWMRESPETSSKRTKISASGTYSSSSNPETPSSYEYNSTSPIERPKGQKEAKRKAKANAIETSFKVIHDTIGKKVTTMEKLAQLKEEENILKKEEMEFKAMEIIMSDTSKMNESQRQIHEKYCNKLKEKYGF
ncbi:glutathione S-transferase T3 [Trifolium repens]|nr:glutathione S-transferase T3 [Trifolium repens]